MKISTLFGFLLFNLFSFSQTINLEWAFNFGNINRDYCRSAIDQNGSLLVAGDFHYNVDFDPSPDTVELFGKRSLFLAKYSQDGNLLWIKDFDTTNTTDGIKTIVTDNANNIYLHGSVGPYKIDFDPGPGVAYLPNDSVFNNKNFVAKFDSDGNFLWVKSINSHTRLIEQIDVDGDGNVYGTGSFNNSQYDFDPGPGVVNLQENASSHAGYIFKWNAQGEHVWTKLIDATFKVEPVRIQYTSDSKVLISGRYYDEVDFDPSSGIENTYNSTGPCSFVAKYDTTGELSWVQSFLSTSVIYGYANEINGNNMIAIYGNFTGSVDADPGPGTDNLAPISGSTGNYVILLNSDGSIAWSRIIADNFFVNKVIADSNGDFYFSGTFQDVCTMFTQYYYFNSPGQNLLVVKTNSNGTIINAYNVANNSGNMLNIRSISTYDNALYFSGDMRDMADFSFNSTTSYTLTSNGDIDSYVVKYQLGALSLKEKEIDTRLTLYPNPGNDLIFISLGKIGFSSQVTINDLNGRIIKEINDFKQKEPIDIYDLLPGTYVIVVSDHNQKTYTTLFIKE